MTTQPLKKVFLLLKKMDAFKIVSSGGRISFEQALELENCSLHELARAANARRWAFSEPGSVGYIVNRMINYSNVCMARCKFCACYQNGRES